MPEVLTVGNLQYQKAYRKQQKTTYKGLTTEQKRYIKAKERYTEMDKALAWFYSRCKRTETGAVDWNVLTEREIDDFEFWNKEKDKAYRQMSRLAEVIDTDLAETVFLQINTHSASF